MTKIEDIEKLPRLLQTVRERGRIGKGFDMTDPTYPHVHPKAGHCLWCGMEVGFFKNGKPKKWCSKYCGTSAASFRSTGRVAPKSRIVAPEKRHCCGCGVELMAGGRERNPKKWCSRACQSRHYRENNPEYVERQAALAKARSEKRAKERDLIDPRPRCESCGKEISRREGARFCRAAACRSASYHAWKETAPECSEGCGRPATAHGLCGSHASAKWRRENPGKAYEVRKRYEMRKRDAWVEDVDSGVVLDRDLWMCGICGKEIPQAAVYPDPLSPSVDHVVPLANGGEHSYANVQAAHFICNSVKRNREEGGQLALT